MVRAFSLTSESLSYFLGFALIHSDPVIIVSPWLSDVNLKLPINDRFVNREVRLLEVLNTLSKKDMYLLVREDEEHNEYIKNRLPQHVQLHEIADLHAKAVVCDEFVYMGSANITHGGLILNRELCEVLENEYGSAKEYISQKLEFDVDL